jgi:hypothetical protein
VAYAEHDMYNSLLAHVIITVRLPHGPIFVMDPAAMQFGWKETVDLAMDYAAHRAQRFAEPEEVAPECPGTRSPSAGNTPPPAGGVRCKDDGPVQTLVVGLLPQIEARFGGVEEFLSLKRSEFEVARAALVAAAKRGLDLLTEEMNAGSEMKIIDVPAAPGIPAGLAAPNRVELVWYKKGTRRWAGGRLRSWGRCGRLGGRRFSRWSCRRRRRIERIVDMAQQRGLLVDRGISATMTGLTRGLASGVSWQC